MKAMNKDKKSFDCVQSKRRAQSRIYHQIRGKTPQQEAAYFDAAMRSGPFSKFWEKLELEGRKAQAPSRLSPPSRRTA